MINEQEDSTTSYRSATLHGDRFIVEPVSDADSLNIKWSRSVVCYHLKIQTFFIFNDPLFILFLFHVREIRFFFFLYDKSDKSLNLRHLHLPRQLENIKRLIKQQISGLQMERSYISFITKQFFCFSRNNLKGYKNQN